MGCTNSKLDDLPAVALCRDRCNFLSQAIQHRYALANAHMVYLLSLKSVGISLQRFFSDLESASAAAPPSPLLNLPAQRKVVVAEGEKKSHAHSHSHSGSHIPTDSDSDSDLSGDSPFHHDHRDDHVSGNSSPVNMYGQMNYGNYGNYETLGSYPIGGFMNNPNMNVNYMKKQPTPSVLYEQRPFSAETMHMEIGDTSSSSASYNYPYSSNYPGYVDQNPNFNNSYYGGSTNVGYGNGYFASGSGYGGGPGAGYGGGPGAGYGGGPGYMPPSGGMMGNPEASSSKPPPPPPSPPRGSAWDFLYPFENFESYYPQRTPSSRSRDSKEVREEEGIPELEDEHEVVKEVYADHKSSQGGGGGNKSYSKEPVEDHHTSKEVDPELVYNNRPNAVAVENDPLEYEVHVVDKKVVGGGERSGDGGDMATFKASADSDVVREIQFQFQRASESGGEVAKLLEVGKLPYKKSGAYQVSSKVLQVITPSLPRHLSAESSAIDKPDPSHLDTDQDSAMRLSNLSSTLHKLYLWEKKLYEEVKVEEKMRVLHERKCRKLKSLDERGAEAHKVDATRALVRSLSTKIRMAIQVVDKISVTINKLRDQELWPQLNEVVQGLTRMWKSMYECHHIQSQAIAQAKKLDALAAHTHFSDSQLQATMDLESELISWTLGFSCWVSEQKGFVCSLNNWLMKCLLYVPEETADGIVPFSPGRLGAPPIFVVCNQWAQAMDRISEKEVVDSMRDFATSILHLWERDKTEMRNRMMVSKDMERKVKDLEREDQKIHKKMQVLDKRIISGADNGLPMTGHVVYQSETSKNGSLQASLRHIFESMERFMSNSVKAYDDLLKRIEEDRQDRLPRETQSES